MLLALLLVLHTAGEPQDGPPAAANAQKAGSKGKAGSDGRFEVHLVPRQSVTIRTELGQVLEFKYVRQGSFTMGSPDFLAKSPLMSGLVNALGQGSIKDPFDEGPPRKTTITKGFYLLKTKITAEVYCEFLNSVPKADRALYVGETDIPTITSRGGRYVSGYDIEVAVNAANWEGASAFALWLSRKTGRKVRLPTEAEWEFAAKGAEGRLYPWGNDNRPEKEVGWKGARVVPSGAFPKNATPEGIQDMLGPTGEWCSDFYAKAYDKRAITDPRGPATGERRVVRGWKGPARGITFARREGFPHRGEGFRILVEE